MSDRREKPAKVISINPRMKHKISSTPYTDLLAQLMSSATPVGDCACTGQIERLLNGFGLLFDRFCELEKRVGQALLKKRLCDAGTVGMVTAF